MANFESYLNDIAYDVKSPNYYKNIRDFHIVKNYVLDIMRREDKYFRQICNSAMLFGSAAHNIRIHDDDEFDVLMELRFPSHSVIIQHEANCRPGFVYLDFSETPFDAFVDDYLANNNHNFLDRCKLKEWLHNIIRNAFNSCDNNVYGMSEWYELSYAWRGIAYTIYAKSNSRTFSIDLVPALKIERSDGGAWYAIPKAKSGPANMSKFTFMLSNTDAEHLLIARGGATLKDALRLLQALRDSKNLPKLRCYHMVSVAIWKAKDVGNYKIFQKSLSEVFLMLLAELCDAFQGGFLSYLWNPDLNLLNNFNKNELSLYQCTLNSAYNTLQSYRHQPTLSFGRCQKHFQ